MSLLKTQDIRKLNIQTKIPQQDIRKMNFIIPKKELPKQVHEYQQKNKMKLHKSPMNDYQYENKNRTQFKYGDYNHTYNTVHRRYGYERDYQHHYHHRRSYIDENPQFVKR